MDDKQMLRAFRAYKRKNSQVRAIRMCRNWFKDRAIFFDTETTGLGFSAEVCEVSIVGWDGDILFDRLIKPISPIPSEAEAIHHISNSMVSKEKSIKYYWGRLKKLFMNNVVVGYNVGFDYRMLLQSAFIAGMSSPGLPMRELHDAMHVFSDFIGEKHQAYHTIKWQKLGKVAEHLNVPVQGNLHRAIADTVLTRNIAWEMAKLDKEKYG